VLTVLDAAAFGRMKELGAVVMGDKKRVRRAACCHMAHGAALAGATLVQRVLEDAQKWQHGQRAGGTGPRASCLHSVVRRLWRRGEAERWRWTAHANEDRLPGQSVEDAVADRDDEYLGKPQEWAWWHPATAALAALEERYGAKPGVLPEPSPSP